MNMKEFEDERLVHKRMILSSMETENHSQLTKWGIQTHTLPVWLMFLTEEVGELAKAIAEYTFRDGKASDIYDEAIQCTTLSAKIAEMIELQETE